MGERSSEGIPALVGVAVDGLGTGLDGDIRRAKDSREGEAVLDSLVVTSDTVPRFRDRVQPATKPPLARRADFSEVLVSVSSQVSKRKK